jgi:hypothetical protein
LEATLYESSTGPEDVYSTSATEDERQQSQSHQQNQIPLNDDHQPVALYHPNLRRDTSKMERDVMEQIEMDLHRQLRNARSISGGTTSTSSIITTTPGNSRSVSQQLLMKQAENYAEGAHQYFSIQGERKTKNFQDSSFTTTSNHVRTNQDNNQFTPSTTQQIVDSWKSRPVGPARRKQLLQAQNVQLSTVLADIERSYEVEQYAGRTTLRKDPHLENSPLRDRDVKQAILLRSSHLLAADRTLGTAVRDRELRHRELLAAMKDIPLVKPGETFDASSVASLLALHLAS